MSKTLAVFGVEVNASAVKFKRSPFLTLDKSGWSEVKSQQAQVAGGVRVGVAVGSGVAVGVSVAVGTRVAVGLGVAVGTGVEVGNGVGVAVGLGVGVTVGLGVEVEVGECVGLAPVGVGQGLQIQLYPVLLQGSWNVSQVRLPPQGHS